MQLIRISLDAVQILVKFKQVVKKTGKSETYNTEELEPLNQYLDEKFLETQDLSFMAVKLNFLMGLRVGELVAIKWTDICDENQLHIVREEIHVQENGALEVVEHTKTNTDRFVVLVPKALDILSKIKHDGEYIFMRDGERITSRQINYVLGKYAERNGPSRLISGRESLLQCSLGTCPVAMAKYEVVLASLINRS